METICQVPAWLSTLCWVLTSNLMLGFEPSPYGGTLPISGQSDTQYITTEWSSVPSLLSILDFTQLHVLPRLITAVPSGFQPPSWRYDLRGSIFKIDPVSFETKLKPDVQRRNAGWASAAPTLEC